VHAHVYQEQAARDAFSAGIDVLQHVGAAGMPPYSGTLVKDIAESGRPVVLTAAHRVWVFPATRQFPERLEDPELERQFPPDMWVELQDSFKQFHTLSVFKNREQEEFFGDASISQWIRAGAVIGMGTDSGTPLSFHRDALWREAKVFVDHGMPAARVITALTWVTLAFSARNATMAPSNRESSPTLRSSKATRSSTSSRWQTSTSLLKTAFLTGIRHELNRTEHARPRP
jgi:hypothetical protein